MRIHITLDDDVVAEIDRRVPRRRRSSFIEQAAVHALRDQQRWESIEAAIGSIGSQGHAWDDNPAAWVRAQRSTDLRRVG